jgi:hypothetical protein
MPGSGWGPVRRMARIVSSWSGITPSSPQNIPALQAWRQQRAAALLNRLKTRTGW